MGNLKNCEGCAYLIQAETDTRKIPYCCFWAKGLVGRYKVPVRLWCYKTVEEIKVIREVRE